MRTLVLTSILLAATVAHADPVVLAVDGTHVYVDLGTRDGVDAGSQLELLHLVVARDPRTGATLRDHFALGTLTVTRSGERVSVAEADAALAKRVLVGDDVRLVSERRQILDPWQQQVAASKAASEPAHGPAGPPTDHVALVRQAWTDTLGAPPEQRIARWQALLAADPATPYHAAIEAEIASLSRQVTIRDAMLARARSARPEDTAPRIARLTAALGTQGAPLAAAPIYRAAPGQPLELAFLVRDPHAVAHAWLYARPEGAPGFTRVELAHDGDSYVRGTIDGALVRGPAVEWYVEVAPPGDHAAAQSALGSHAVPNRIDLDLDVTEPPPQPHRSHVDLHVDYVDWDGKLGQGFDQYYQAEADFKYRFLDPIYSVSLGFGTLSGTGGPKDVIDSDPAHCMDAAGTYRCKRVDYSYVYTELEQKLSPNVAVMVRPTIGRLATDDMPGTAAGRCKSSPDTTGCDLSVGFGLRGRLRLGDEAATNLVLGAAFTQGLGTLLEASYHWLAVPVVPVQITVQVTDQPVIDDFGVRLVGDVGYRGWGAIYPSVRVSYQARDIKHSGVSGGAALNFDW